MSSKLEQSHYSYLTEHNTLKQHATTTHSFPRDYIIQEIFGYLLTM